MMLIFLILGILIGIGISGILLIIEIYLSHRTQLILPRISQELEPKGFVELPDKRAELFKKAFHYEEDVQE